MSTPDTRAIAAQLQNLDLSGVPDAYNDQDDESEESGGEDTHDGSNSEAEEELFTELMKLKGSSYHELLKKSLKQ